jgi:hypothetical protein
MVPVGEVDMGNVDGLASHDLNPDDLYAAMQSDAAAEEEHQFDNVLPDQSDENLMGGPKPTSSNVPSPAMTPAEVSLADSASDNEFYDDELTDGDDSHGSSTLL